ncbi:hypothetical protein QJS10_CPB20g00765 [Acorus calamus]|uniref:Uncharacterized protein n=1 Tax=Acorus calamus TaxID=4465 RepID=A0AAV9C832_ACOCL|nr:hypothetical protein QJS10_CPB20g00765 [Acorus calamus]
MEDDFDKPMGDDMMGEMPDDMDLGLVLKVGEKKEIEKQGLNKSSRRARAWNTPDASDEVQLSKLTLSQIRERSSP